MICQDLSERVVAGLPRVDLATVTKEPASPLGTFEFHGCTWGVASFVGSPPWECHTGGDELVHVLDGQSELTVIEDGRRLTRTLETGTVAVIPMGCWHRNHASVGVTMIFMTPADGNRISWDDPEVAE